MNFNKILTAVIILSTFFLNLLAIELDSISFVSENHVDKSNTIFDPDTSRCDSISASTD